MSNTKILLTLQPFVINLGSIGSGKHHFEAQVGKEFFEAFGNEDILDADIKVEADILVGGLSARVEAQVYGSVSVPCDRCLAPLEIPVDTEFSQEYKPEGLELDFSQEVYDFVCLSLPLKRVHEDGECDSEVTKYLVDN